MQKGEEEKKTHPANQETNNGPTIVKTDVGAKDGQNKCPKCGSTDIETNTILIWRKTSFFWNILENSRFSP